jgi:RecG-like helicase
VLARSEDGFEIAEEDLRRRGMGDLAGLRQAGENAEGFAGPDELDLLLLARRIAAEQPEVLRAYAATDPRAADA